MSYDERKEQLIVLSEYDEGERYEVDQGCIGIDKQTKKYVLLTASG